LICFFFLICRCIYIANAATELTLRGLGLSGCEATSSSFSGIYGGAIYVESGAILHAMFTTIKESKAVSGRGGAIYSSGSAVINVYDSHISTSEATYGGGIYANWPATLTIVRSTISKCVAQVSGGNIFLNGKYASSSSTSQSNLVLNDSAINEGIARTYNGGGLYVGAFSQAAISGSVISSSIGYRHGAGIYFHGSPYSLESTFKMSDRCVVRNNTIIGGGSDDSYSGTRTYHGAGVWVASGIVGSISETRFEGNTGATYGGGKYDIGLRKSFSRFLFMRGSFLNILCVNTVCIP
jgi:hypothetical protein